MFFKPRLLYSTFIRPVSSLKMPKTKNLFSFSSFYFSKKQTKDPDFIDWESKDYEEINELLNENKRNKKYQDIMRQWEAPLERKRIRRAKRQEREAQFVHPPPEPELLVVHNPSQPVTYPPDPYGIFAIIKIKGMQYKVTKDATVMIESLSNDSKYSSN